jgi:hypothetical protein
LGLKLTELRAKPENRSHETQRSLGLQEKMLMVLWVKTNAAIKAGRAKEIASYRENTPLQV